MQTGRRALLFGHASRSRSRVQLQRCFGALRF
jgi:hypothetical protein